MSVKQWISLLLYSTTSSQKWNTKKFWLLSHFFTASRGGGESWHPLNPLKKRCFHMSGPQEAAKAKTKHKANIMTNSSCHLWTTALACTTVATTTTLGLIHQQPESASPASIQERENVSTTDKEWIQTKTFLPYPEQSFQLALHQEILLPHLLQTSEATAERLCLFRSESF